MVFYMFLLLVLPVRSSPIPQQQDSVLANKAESTKGPVGAASVQLRDGSSLFFGGRTLSSSNSQELVNVVYHLNSTSLQVSALNVTGTKDTSIPPPSYRHCCATDTTKNDNVMYCFGGISGGNRIWRFDYDSKSWIDPIILPDKLNDENREGHRCSVYQSKFLVWGGTVMKDNQRIIAPSFFTYDLVTKTYTSTPAESSRYLSSSVYNGTSNIVIFGLNASSPNQPVGTVLFLDPSTGDVVSRISPSNTTSVISGSACTFINRTVYCFGGQMFNETTSLYSLTSRIWMMNLNQPNANWELLWEEPKSNLRRRHNLKTSSAALQTATPSSPTASAGSAGTSLPSGSSQSQPSASATRTVSASPSTPSSTNNPDANKNLYPLPRWSATISSINGTYLAIWGGGSPSPNVDDFNGDSDTSYGDANVYFFNIKSRTWDPISTVLGSSPTNGGEKDNNGGGGISLSGNQKSFDFWIIFVVLAALMAVGVVVWAIRWRYGDKNRKRDAVPMDSLQDDTFSADHRDLESGIDPDATLRNVRDRGLPEAEYSAVNDLDNVVPLAVSPPVDSNEGANEVDNENDESERELPEGSWGLLSGTKYSKIAPEKPENERCLLGTNIASGEFEAVDLQSDNRVSGFSGDSILKNIEDDMVRESLDISKEILSLPIESIPVLSSIIPEIPEEKEAKPEIIPIVPIVATKDEAGLLTSESTHSLPLSSEKDASQIIETPPTDVPEIDQPVEVSEVQNLPESDSEEEVESPPSNTAERSVDNVEPIAKPDPDTVEEREFSTEPEAKDSKDALALLAAAAAISTAALVSSKEKKPEPSQEPATKVPLKLDSKMDIETPVVVPIPISKNDDDEKDEFNVPEPTAVFMSKDLPDEDTEIAKDYTPEPLTLSEVPESNVVDIEATADSEANDNLLNEGTFEEPKEVHLETKEVLDDAPALDIAAKEFVSETTAASLVEEKVQEVAIVDEPKLSESEELIIEPVEVADKNLEPSALLEESIAIVDETPVDSRKSRSEKESELPIIPVLLPAISVESKSIKEDSVEQSESLPLAESPADETAVPNPEPVFSPELETEEVVLDESLLPEVENIPASEPVEEAQKELIVENDGGANVESITTDDMIAPEDSINVEPIPNEIDTIVEPSEPVLVPDEEFASAMKLEEDKLPEALLSPTEDESLSLIAIESAESKDIQASEPIDNLSADSERDIPETEETSEQQLDALLDEAIEESPLQVKDVEIPDMNPQDDLTKDAEKLIDALISFPPIDASEGEDSDVGSRNASVIEEDLPKVEETPIEPELVQPDAVLEKVESPKAEILAESQPKEASGFDTTEEDNLHRFPSLDDSASTIYESDTETIRNAMTDTTPTQSRAHSPIRPSISNASSLSSIKHSSSSHTPEPRELSVNWPPNSDYDDSNLSDVGDLNIQWPPLEESESHLRDVSHLSVQWPPSSPSLKSKNKDVSSLQTSWPPAAPIGIDVPDLTAYVPGQSTDYVATRAFFPTRSDEIALDVGDLVAIECRWDDDWARVQNVTRGRKRGVVPMNVLKEIRSGPSRRVQSVKTVYVDPKSPPTSYANLEGVERRSFIAKHTPSSSKIRADFEAKQRLMGSEAGQPEAEVSEEIDSDEEEERRYRREAISRVVRKERVSSLYRAGY
ncbi:hypothetical protein HK098_002272 [Nowakowskiella sp. JEL0407]|nr:hypothetical protein HK098_002272 [Nowakowskiella sp. JEL0407]